MMAEANKNYVIQMRTELLGIISRCNEKIQETDNIDDVDKDTLRALRGSLIQTVDEINHLEYKELL